MDSIEEDCYILDSDAVYIAVVFAVKWSQTRRKGPI